MHTLSLLETLSSLPGVRRVDLTVNPTAWAVPGVRVTVTVRSWTVSATGWDVDEALRAALAEVQAAACVAEEVAQ